MNPFGRPPITSGQFKTYAPATGPADSFRWSPVQSGNFNIAPQGRGDHAIAFHKPAGRCIRLAFDVSQLNRIADFWRFVKSRLPGSTQIPMAAAITLDFDGEHIATRPHIATDPAGPAGSLTLAGFAGRATDTDSPFGWYVAPGYPHNGATFEMPLGNGYIWIDTPDGSEAWMPLSHMGSN